MNAKVVTIILISGGILSSPISYGADAMSSHKHIEVLSMVATGNYAEALSVFERQEHQLEKEMPDISFYIAECHYQEGHFDEAEKIFRQVLTTPFNKEEAYGRLIEIARRKADSEAVAKYATAMRELQEQMERQYKKISQREAFTSEPGDDEQETLRKALKYYTDRQGFPGEVEGDALMAIAHYRDAITAYEYSLGKHVPLSERFRSPLARRLYGKLESAFSQYGEALKKNKKPETEVSHASVMARYYANKAAVVRSQSGSE